MPDRFRTLPADSFDTIVVGAGLGGLCAAALLAKRGARVLVVDRHYVAGGNATIFKRRGYEFDVGLHYIGGAGPLGVVPRLLGACGADPVEFEELDPDGFDTLVFPDLTFRMPKGIAAFRRRLLEHFPAEAPGIERYLSLLEPLVQFQRARQSAYDALRVLPRTLHLLRWSTSTYDEFLRRCTSNERLRAVLAGQSGDYALPPSRAALPMAAGLVAHYLDGAYFPRGGGQVVSDRLAEAIERQGGKILLRASVRQIVVEQGRVAGVELESKHLGARFVRAPVVISNADLKKTMRDLVGARHVRPRTTTRTQAYEMAPALGVVYLGLRRDLRAEGHPRTNYWVHGSYDSERPYAAVRRGELPDEPFAFISIATLKDPTNTRLAPPGVTNLQVMGLAPSAPAAWGVTEAEARDGSYGKSESYRRRKHQFGEMLIEAARRVFPSLRDEITYCEVATPLTHGRFTSSTDGTSYGIAATPAQSLWNRPSARTEIEGLYLCGASCRAGHGIVGAMVSGAMAASAVRRHGSLGRLVHAVGRGARDTLAARAPASPRLAVEPPRA
jgi:all-trans-retinol 13,14-reductase